MRGKRETKTNRVLPLGHNGNFGITVSRRAQNVQTIRHVLIRIKRLALKDDTSCRNAFFDEPIPHDVGSWDCLNRSRIKNTAGDENYVVHLLLPKLKPALETKLRISRAGLIQRHDTAARNQKNALSTFHVSLPSLLSFHDQRDEKTYHFFFFMSIIRRSVCL